MEPHLPFIPKHDKFSPLIHSRSLRDSPLWSCPRNKWLFLGTTACSKKLTFFWAGSICTESDSLGLTRWESFLVINNKRVYFPPRNGHKQQWSERDFWVSCNPWWRTLHCKFWQKRRWERFCCLLYKRWFPIHASLRRFRSYEHFISRSFHRNTGRRERTPPEQKTGVSCGPRQTTIHKWRISDWRLPDPQARLWTWRGLEEVRRSQPAKFRAIPRCHLRARRFWPVAARLLAGLAQGQVPRVAPTPLLPADMGRDQHRRVRPLRGPAQRRPRPGTAGDIRRHASRRGPRPWRRRITAAAIRGRDVRDALLGTRSGGGFSPPAFRRRLFALAEFSCPRQVVPGKFIAFKGPEDLGRQVYRDDGGYRRSGRSRHARFQPSQLTYSGAEYVSFFFNRLILQRAYGSLPRSRRVFTQPSQERAYFSGVHRWLLLIGRSRHARGSGPRKSWTFQPVFQEIFKPFFLYLFIIMVACLDLVCGGRGRFGPAYYVPLMYGPKKL